jgi:hypothetical protein
MAGRNPSPAHVVKPNATTADIRSRTIGRGVKQVSVLAVTNGVTDFITLPHLVSVPEGHEITIVCSAGTAFELRTPVGSSEKINTADSDGSAEYLCTDGAILHVTKVSNTIGWQANSFTEAGAVIGAVSPD